MNLSVYQKKVYITRAVMVITDDGIIGLGWSEFSTYNVRKVLVNKEYFNLDLRTDLFELINRFIMTFVKSSCIE